MHLLHSAHIPLRVHRAVIVVMVDAGENVGDAMAALLAVDWEDDDIQEIVMLSAAALYVIMEQEAMRESVLRPPKRRRKPDPVGMDPAQSPWALMLAAG